MPKVCRIVVLAIGLASSSCETGNRVTVDARGTPTFLVEEVSPCGGRSPGHASGITIKRRDTGTIVWMARGPRHEMSEPIVYGRLPSGWTHDIGPEPLDPAEKYSVHISGGFGLNGTAEFKLGQAPKD